jgi:hypothetical protein
VITDFGAELDEPAAPSRTTPPSCSPTFSACETYREAIEAGLWRGRNAMAIWQDLVDTCGSQATERAAIRPQASPRQEGWAQAAQALLSFSTGLVRSFPFLPVQEHGTEVKSAPPNIQHCPQGAE